MITLIGDRDLRNCSALGTKYKIQEMYIDTDAFYKMFYVFNQMGLGDYFTFEVDQNGQGVYIRLLYKEESRIDDC